VLAPPVHSYFPSHHCQHAATSLLAVPINIVHVAVVDSRRLFHCFLLRVLAPPVHSYFPSNHRQHAATSLLTVPINTLLVVVVDTRQFFSFFATRFLPWVLAPPVHSYVPSNHCQHATSLLTAPINIVLIVVPCVSNLIDTHSSLMILCTSYSYQFSQLVTVVDVELAFSHRFRRGIQQFLRLNWDS
jgi:hypothetical protein